MTALKIREIIEAELKNGLPRNWHGISGNNVNKHLIEPVIEAYEDALDPALIHSYWTVLHEHPDDKSGYTIFYSGKDDEFGLAVRGKNAPYCAIGLYGSFSETLSAM